MLYLMHRYFIAQSLSFLDLYQFILYKSIKHFFIIKQIYKKVTIKQLISYINNESDTS